jgi:hypothetical protein
VERGFPNPRQIFIADELYDCKVHFSPAIAEMVEEVIWF